jgi:hypothetical protein
VNNDAVMVKNQSAHEHDLDVMGNESINDSGKPPRSYDCNKLVASTLGIEVVSHHIASVFMIAMLIMSNVSAIVLRGFYR